MAANAGVQDCLFKRHGRWKSEGANDGYMEDSTAKRLLVLQQLGLYPFVLSFGKDSRLAPLCHSMCYVYSNQVVACHRAATPQV